MSDARSHLRRNGRAVLITAALGLALAAGIAVPALATGNTGPLDKPQPLSKADRNTGGANGQCPGGPYCSTRDGSPSMNGNGKGGSVGKPCAGCVGKADNKNPRGQMPNGSDHNNGYECDGNHGIGRGNPAHTGCGSVDNPPVDNPPVDNPPVDNPPVDNPPVDNPPVDNPPVDTPPKGDNPPVDTPPVDNPPVDNPPVDNPPVGNPPVGNPPVDTPPKGDNPPVDNPVDTTPVGLTPVVLGNVVDSPPVVLGNVLDAPQVGKVLTPQAAPQAANPLPTSAAAGEANTSGQLLAGGFAAFAALLAFGAGIVLRRRHGDA